MKIAVIFTGGTIGSKGFGGIISNNPEMNYRLLELYSERTGKTLEAVTVEPYNILSENLNFDHIGLLKNAVEKVLQNSEIEGVIVTHGTDTIQYSAAALQYYFATSSRPIILVSSAYVLDDERANGVDNFIGAVKFIESGAGKGVFVSYRNVDSDTVYFHRGTRLNNPVSYSSDIGSILDSWYARLIDDKIKLNPDYSCSSETITFESAGNQLLSGKVMRLQVYPEMIYPELDSEIRAVLIEGYHSGTASADERMKRFMEEANRRHIMVYLIGLQKNNDEYSTVEEYRRLRIIPLPNCAAISQYMKLVIAISNNLDLNEVMNKEIAEDVV